LKVFFGAVSSDLDEVHTFTTRIGKIGYPALRDRAPPIVRALGSATRIPVLARYGGETTLSTLTPAGGAKRRLVLQMSVLRPASLDVGDMIEVSLESTTESHKQWLPPDVARALQFRPAAAAELDRSAPSTWRIIVERLEAGAHARDPTAAESNAWSSALQKWPRHGRKRRARPKLPEKVSPWVCTSSRSPPWQSSLGIVAVFAVVGEDAGVADAVDPNNRSTLAA
jgi:hypothetical protein